MEEEEKEEQEEEEEEEQDGGVVMIHALLAFSTRTFDSCRGVRQKQTLLKSSCVRYICGKCHEKKKSGPPTR